MIKNSYIIYTSHSRPNSGSAISSGAISWGLSNGAIITKPPMQPIGTYQTSSGCLIGPTGPVYQKQPENIGIIRLQTLEGVEVNEPKILTPDLKIEDTIQDPNLGEVYLKASISYNNIQSRIYFLINNDKYHTIPQHLFNDYTSTTSARLDHSIEIIKLVLCDDDLEWIRLAYNERKKQLANNIAS